MSATVTAGRSVGCAAYNKAAHNQPPNPPASQAGCAAAQPAQPPPMGYMMPDPLPPPWYWATDLYRRLRRRPRCDGQEGMTL